VGSNKNDREHDRKYLVMTIVDLALEKAQKLTPERLFEIVISPKDVPEGIDSEEITITLAHESSKTGLVYMNHRGWTFRFYKMTRLIGPQI